MRLFLLILSSLAFSASAYCAPGCSPASETSPSPILPSPAIIDRYVSDPALHRSWAVITDCVHPNWPPQLVEIRPGEARSAGTRNGPVRGKQVRGIEQTLQPDTQAIQSGWRVELWSDGPPRIRLSGTALESGSLGKLISVRAGLGAVPLHGIVRGPHSVELQVNKSVRSEP